MSLFGNVTQKFSNTVKATAQKSSELVEVTKLNLSISAEEDKIKKVYGDIGKALYEAYARGEEVSEAFKESCEQIKVYEQNIKQMKQKILELKKMKACPNCGFEMENDVAFCSKCGAKQ